MDSCWETVGRWIRVDYSLWMGLAALFFLDGLCTMMDAKADVYVTMEMDAKRADATVDGWIRVDRVDVKVRVDMVIVSC